MGLVDAALQALETMDDEYFDLVTDMAYLYEDINSRIDKLKDDLKVISKTSELATEDFTIDNKLVELDETLDCLSKFFSDITEMVGT